MSVLVSLLLSFFQLDFTREQQDIIVRMSGCPNGCSRPWLGEIAFVGRSMEVDAATGAVDGIYDMYIGGNERGDRFANMYRQGINEPTILAELRPMFKEWKKARGPLALSLSRSTGPVRAERTPTRRLGMPPCDV